MSNFKDKIAAAKAVKRPFKDVTVALDGGVSDELKALTADREALTNPSDKRLSRKPDTSDIDAKIAAIQAREAENLVTLRFFKVPGDEWAELTATNPRREGSAIDYRFGYNMHAVCRASAILHGRVVEGDAEEVLEAAEWAELWPLLGGAEFATVCDAIYRLNELDPTERVERLKNFSEAATASAKK